MVRKKYSIDEIVYLLIVIFPLITLIQELLPFSPNRVAMFLLLICFVCQLFRLRKNKVLYFLLYIMVQISILLVMSGDIAKCIDDMIYYVSIFVEIMLLANSGFRKRLFAQCRQKSGFMLAILLLCEGIVALNMTMSSCYSTKWHDVYFIGWTAHQHTMASVCSVLIIFSLLLSATRFRGSVLKPLFMMAIPVLGVMLSGARTFLVPAFLAISAHLIKKYQKHPYSVVFLGCVSAFALITVLDSTNMLAKITQASAYQGTWYYEYILTSGRNVFWDIDIKAFKALPVLQQFFGKGFDWVYYINLTQYKLEIWAHNDLLHVLMGAGFFGLLNYLFLYVGLLRSLRHHLTRLDKLIVSLYIFFPMLLNGFFVYQHFVFGAMLFVIYIEANHLQQATEGNRRHCDPPDTGVLPNQ